MPDKKGPGEKIRRLKSRVMELERRLRGCRRELDVQVWGLNKTNEAVKLLYKDLEKKNEKLRELDKLKSEFAFNVSHELKTPIAIIKGSLFMLIDKKCGHASAEQKDLLNGAMKATDRLAKMIDDILDFQKFGVKRLKLNARENDMNSAVREICHTLAFAARDKNLKFFVRLDQRPLKARFDREQITQVVGNLIDNAVKYTDKGSITVSAKKDKRSVHVSVSDTGCGIRKKDLPRLFNPFERIGPRGKKGTGLGLSICRTIIEKHRGNVWAESEFGKGSVFHFTVPAM